MKLLKLLSLFAVSLMLSFSAYGQEMPPDNVMGTISCNLADGVSMGELVAWARANPRTPGSNNLGLVVSLPASPDWLPLFFEGFSRFFAVFTIEGGR